ncbi:MAG TPA: hypothetical protein VL981_13530 [Candidatus Methylacidiphilales bacterium]|nr:hypothetical protein [Candidatus Methylacidiphilales bacterium]
MSFHPEELFQSLDNPEVLRWVPQLKYGKPAYSAIVDALKNNKLNAVQTRNALHALFRIRLHGSSKEVLDTFVEFSQVSNVSIRSEAVQLAIGLVRFSQKVNDHPVAFSKEQIASLKHAVALGLKHDVHKLAVEYLGEG